MMPAANPLRRYLEAAAFVAVWMVWGWLLRMNTNVYLLFGVPLLVLFQVAVRRLPLRQLWLRDPRQTLRIDRWAVALGLLFMAAPAT